jgi:hypothetical protein
MDPLSEARLLRVLRQPVYTNKLEDLVQPAVSACLECLVPGLCDVWC